MKYGKKEMQKMPGGGRLMDYMMAGGKLMMGEKGLKMVKNDKGEMVPFFAADGKGKMEAGGKMRGYKMGVEGMEVESDKKKKRPPSLIKSGDPMLEGFKTGDVFREGDGFYQVGRTGNASLMSYSDMFNYLDDNQALVIPGGEGANQSGKRSAARNGIQEAFANNDMDLLVDYIKPGFGGITGLAVRSAETDDFGRTEGAGEEDVSKGALSRKLMKKLP